jgi:hypothetical protein
LPWAYPFVVAQEPSEQVHQRGFVGTRPVLDDTSQVLGTSTVHAIRDTATGLRDRENKSTPVSFVPDPFDVSVFDQLCNLPTDRRRIRIHHGSQLARAHRAIAKKSEQADEGSTLDAPGLHRELRQLALTNALKPNQLRTELLGVIDSVVVTPGHQLPLKFAGRFSNTDVIASVRS